MHFKGVLRDQQLFSQQSDVDKRHGLFRRQMFLAEDVESCLHTDVKSKEFLYFLTLSPLSAWLLIPLYSITLESNVR